MAKNFNEPDHRKLAAGENNFASRSGHPLSTDTEKLQIRINSTAGSYQTGTVQISRVFTRYDKSSAFPWLLGYHCLNLKRSDESFADLVNLGLPELGKDGKGQDLFRHLFRNRKRNIGVILSIYLLAMQGDRIVNG